MTMRVSIGKQFHVGMYNFAKRCPYNFVDVDAREIKDIRARGKRTPSGDIDTGYGKYLHRLRIFLGSVPGVTLSQAKPHAVNFYYYGIEVDLLVSPNWRDLDALWTFLQDVDRDHLFE